MFGVGASRPRRRGGRVRLQRTPTRIHIDAVPEAVRVNSGMTCTVVVESPACEWAIPSPIRRGFARWRQPTERKAKVQAMRDDSMQRLPWPHHSQSKGNEDSRLPRASTNIREGFHASGCDMSDGRPLFAFAFRDGKCQAPSTFVEVDAAARNADLLWVHLDLSDAAALSWLHCRPWPPDVVELVAVPIQRQALRHDRSDIRPSA
jgi:hypothetical protein